MAKVRLGFISLESSQVHFYPQWLRDLRGQPGGGLLPFYAQQLGTIEMTSTNYAIPSPSTTRRWAEEVPPGFTFHVKLFGLFTFGTCKRSALPPSALAKLKARAETVRLSHLPADVLEEVWRCFVAALAPLREQSKLGVVMAQFTAAFVPCEGSYARLREICARILPSRLAAEFRSPEWSRSREACRCLDDLGVVSVATDDNGSHNRNNSFHQLPDMVRGRSLGYCRIHRRPVNRVTGLICEDVTAEDIEASSVVDPRTGRCSGDLSPEEVSNWGRLLAGAAVEAASDAEIFVLVSTVGHNASADNVFRLRDELGPDLAVPWPLPEPPPAHTAAGVEREVSKRSLDGGEVPAPCVGAEEAPVSRRWRSGAARSAEAARDEPAGGASQAERRGGRWKRGSG